jgi:hypothetical protein
MHTFMGSLQRLLWVGGYSAQDVQIHGTQKLTLHVSAKQSFFSIASASFWRLVRTPNSAKKGSLIQFDLYCNDFILLKIL